MFRFSPFGSSRTAPELTIWPNGLRLRAWFESHHLPLCTFLAVAAILWDAKRDRKKKNSRRRKQVKGDQMHEFLLEPVPRHNYRGNMNLSSPSGLMSWKTNRCSRPVSKLGQLSFSYYTGILEQLLLTPLSSDLVISLIKEERKETSMLEYDKHWRIYSKAKFACV